MRDALNRHFDVVLAESLDRFTRDEKTRPAYTLLSLLSPRCVPDCTRAHSFARSNFIDSRLT